MWKFFARLLPIALTIVFIQACLLAGAQNKTLVVRPSKGEFAGKTFYTNSHALIIGISKYRFLPKEKQLEFAAEDAKSVRDVLVRSYGFLPENVTILLDDQATRKNIEDALSALADDTKVKTDDRILVFFSGHGQTLKLSNGGDTGFLIPYDAKVDLSRPDNRGPYLSTCIRMDNVWGYLEGSPAKHSLLIADACFGEGSQLCHWQMVGQEGPARGALTFWFAHFCLHYELPASAIRRAQAGFAGMLLMP